MIHNRSPSMDSSVYNVHANSQEWRSNEARDMFVLLLGEYENSKRLSFPQRYKELERIISMFTSEPVLEKLKWLSEDDQDEKDIDDESDGAASSQNELFCGESDESNTGDDDALANPTIGIQMRRFISKMKSLSKFSTLCTTTTAASSTTSSVSSSSPTTPISDITDVSALSFSTNSSSSISPSSSSSRNINISHCYTCNNFLCNVNNNSAPTTPVATSQTPGLPHCMSLPLFKRFQSELPESHVCPTSLSFEKDLSINTTTNTPSSISSIRQRTSSSSSTEADSYINFQPRDRSTSYTASSSSTSSASCNQRRNEFDKCIIKQNQIPAFEIPPLRTTSHSKTDKIDPDMIVPSLYMVSNPTSPTSEKSFSRFRGSSSSPNISRFFGLDNNQSNSNLSSYSKGFFSKIRQAVRRDYKSENSFDIGSISDSSESSCSSNIDIQRKHSMLMKMKEEYDELPNWNVLSRYTKMKKMLKSCGKLDTE